MAIVHGKYDSALHFFSEAFANVSGGLSGDFANAAVCAVKSGHDQMAYQYLDSLISLGVRREFFETFQGIAALRKTSEWAQYMEEFENNRHLLTLRFNAELGALLLEMHEKDQEFRVKEGSYLVYGDTIRFIDSINVIRYRNIIDEYGFPGERLIGTDKPADDIPGYIVLHHHCQAMSIGQEPVKYDFTDDFVHAVRNGKVEPHHIAFLISLQGKDALQLDGHGVMQLETSDGTTSPYLRSRYSPEMQSEIRKNRKLLGLERQEEYYVKSLFKLKDDAVNDFIFHKYGRLNLYPGLDRDTYARFRAACEVVE